MNSQPPRRRKPLRRAATLVLSAALIAATLGMVAIAVEVGHVMLARTQLQLAADSAAMAAAAHLGRPLEKILAAAGESCAGRVAGAKPVRIDPPDVESGLWDSHTRTFTPWAETRNAVRVNAVRVTVRCDASAGGEPPLLFARLFGRDASCMSASAVAVANPRDIAFVIDLSGSMNDDTEPCWGTGEINSTFAAEGHPAIGDELIEQLYDDFGFGPYPGVVEYLGAPWGVPQDEYAYAELTKDGGPLTDGTVPEKYRILPDDSELTRKQKAYSAIIDAEIARIMPAALPSPDSATNYEYWEKYLDYVIDSVEIVPPADRGWLPPDQDGDRIGAFNNPNQGTFPGAQRSVPSGFSNQIGYVTYVQFMMDHGRDLKPEGRTYVPLSTYSPDCPWHAEQTAGGTLRFPPREQPAHAVRRALIEAIALVQERNAGIDPDQADWVSIIAFDTLSGGGPVVEQPLTADYGAAMLACTKLQAVGDKGATTATEAGLETARLHVRARTEGGQGRLATSKLVVLLTDGAPDLCSSDPAPFERFIRDNPSHDYYGHGAHCLDAPLMQAAMMRQEGWRVYAVAVGSGADYDFLDRLARIGGTADDGESLRGGANPARCEKGLADVFEQIITSPQVRLVQ